MSLYTDLLFDVSRFYRDLMQNQYRQCAGRTTARSVLEIYKAHQHLLRKETITLLQEALCNPETPDETVSPKVLAFLLEYIVEHFLAASGWQYRVTLSQRQEQAKVPLSEEEEIPLLAVPSRLTAEGKRHRRAFLATMAEAVSAELHPVYQEYWQQLSTSVTNLGYANYALLWKEIGRLDLEQLEQAGKRFLHETEEMYLDVLRWMLKKRADCSLKEAQRHDLLFLFRGEEFDRYFPSTGIMTLLQGMTAELIPDREEQPAIRWEGGEGTQFLYTACVPVEVPERVHLLLAPRGGWKDYQHLLQEYGKALYYTHIPADTLFPYRVLGDRSLWMSYAFLWASLTRERTWLAKYEGFQQSEEYIRLSALEKLFIIRRYVAKLRYELTCHQEGLREEMADAYVEYMAEACRVKYPRALYLSELESNLLPAWYLRAWFFEAGLRASLQEQYGEEWFRDPAAGLWLQELWRLGQEYSLEELCTRGYATLNPGALIADFANKL
jgi:hypothetical protein